MYGIVNRAIRDLVLERAGEDKWSEICSAAGLEFEDFSDTSTYDDSVSYDLIAASAEALGLSAYEVLVMFGRHWILYTGKDGWGHLLEMAGDDLRSMIGGLDALHSRVESAMPDSRMPSFTSTNKPDGVIEVAYRSDREGLEPMVIGLFQGIAERFDEQWSVSHDGQHTEGGPHMFTLRPIPVRSALEGKSVGAV